MESLSGGCTIGWSLGGHREGGEHGEYTFLGGIRYNRLRLHYIHEFLPFFPVLAVASNRAYSCAMVVFRVLNVGPHRCSATVQTISGLGVTPA